MKHVVTLGQGGQVIAQFENAVDAINHAACLRERGTPALASTRTAPNGPQKYLGAQNHTWEDVIPSEDANDRDDVVDRLRVPGGWLYRNGARMVFVPMPEAVGYAV